MRLIYLASPSVYDADPAAGGTLISGGGTWDYTEADIYTNSLELDGDNTLYYYPDVLQVVVTFDSISYSAGSQTTLTLRASAARDSANDPMFNGDFQVYAYTPGDTAHSQSPSWDIGSQTDGTAIWYIGCGLGSPFGGANNILDIARFRVTTGGTGTRDGGNFLISIRGYSIGYIPTKPNV